MQPLHAALLAALLALISCPSNYKLIALYKVNVGMEVVIHMPPSIHQQHMFSISRKSFVSIPRYPRLRSVKHHRQFIREVLSLLNHRYSQKLRQEVKHCHHNWLRILYLFWIERHKVALVGCFKVLPDVSDDKSYQINLNIELHNVAKFEVSRQLE